MASCQISALANSIFTTAMTAGIIGLAVLAFVLITKVLTPRRGRLETVNPAVG